MNLKITKLKDLTPNDAHDITALSAQLGYATSLVDLTSRTTIILKSNQDCIFVARQEQQIVAFIHAFLAIRVESPLFVEIAALVVDENFRKMNLGRQLIAAVKAWSSDLHVPIIRVRCNAIRLESHKFYEQVGFALSKQQKIFEVTI